MNISLAFATIALTVFTPSASEPDDEIDIVGPELVTLLASSGDESAAALCLAYGRTVGAIPSDLDGADILRDAVAAYIIVAIEGDALRLDNEARDALTDWLHSDCTP